LAGKGHAGQHRGPHRPRPRRPQRRTRATRPTETASPCAGASSAASRRRPKGSPKARGLAAKDPRQRSHRIDLAKTLDRGTDQLPELVRKPTSSPSPAIGKPGADDLRARSPRTSIAVVSRTRTAFGPEPRALPAVSSSSVSKSVAAKTLGLDRRPAHDDTDATRHRRTARPQLAATPRPLKRVHTQPPESHSRSPDTFALRSRHRRVDAGAAPDLLLAGSLDARTWKGGNSFKGFIENTRKEALRQLCAER